MSNHVDNDLFIRGNRKNITEFKVYIKSDKDNIEDDANDKYYFDFDKFIPYPEEYAERDRISRLLWDVWNRGIQGLEFRLWCIKNGYGELYIDSPMEYKDAYNIEGYNWCIANRGTKWNSYSTRISTDSDTRLTINFNTAWSPPEPVIIKASEMFPELTFTLKYYECGACYKGVLKCKAGEILEQWSGEYKGNRGG